QHSDDNGASWSSSREITGSVIPEGSRWYATGPGHGIQLSRAEHAGRLIAPMNYSAPDDNGAGVIFSDDGGDTWRPGGLV
ncbi:exo-alpha-sialidase, partial [Tritonibacter sp. SIMBA_163]|uniref:exo-alpha-sialidase n=1 Tax=Tritonibacter sp. SIMBA_163 TaxID=3080868 RepID=UPI0039802D5F